jgi:hypothetical protein
MKRRSRNNLHTQEMLYRPALEFRSAVILVFFPSMCLLIHGVRHMASARSPSIAP